MTRLQFVKPTPWRAFWSLALASLMVYVIWIIVVYILAITTQADSSSPPIEHGGLLGWDAVFAAPLYALMFWFITVPAVIVLGALVATVRRSGTSR